MASFVYDGEQAMVFPTIGLTVEPGASFEAPDDFVAGDVSPAKKGKPAVVETAPVIIEPTPVEEGN